MSKTDMSAKEVDSSEEFKLLARIEAFDLESPKAKLTFSHRLSRENGWKHDYTRRVVDEYKRFAFLAMVAEHPVTPSDPVDQAWHLHMIYTESYWKEFCGEVLQKPLHHGPTKGGAQEGAKHFDWYMRTLESYRKWFKEEPPEDIWPRPDERFTDAAYFTRINTRHSWVIPKPAFWKTAERVWREQRWIALCPFAWRLAWATCLTLLFVGCVGSIDVFNYSGPEFLEFYFCFAVLWIMAVALWRHVRRLPARSAQDSDLPSTPYEIACLAGGSQRVVETAFAELLRTGALEVQANGTIRASATIPTDQELHPVEARLRATLGTTNGESFSAVQRRLNTIAEPIIEELSDRGLMLSYQTANSLRRKTLAVACLAPAVGAVKIMVGISRDKPVGILVVLTLIATMMIIGIFSRRPLRSRLGDSAFQLLRKRYADLRRESALDGALAGHNGTLATAVGLFGFSMLANTAFTEEYRRVTVSYGASIDSSSGCGSSDGGSGCGSGCGGCGGGGD